MNRRLLLALFFLTLLQGCGKSLPTTYYAFDEAPITLSTDSLPAKTLRIARVGIPQYLDREALVQREPGAVALSIDSLHLWAEPLADGVRRLVASVLAKPLLSSGLLVLPKASEDTGTYTLLFDVLQLDGKAGGKANISAHWELLASASNTSLQKGLFSAEKAVAGETNADLVAAWGELLQKAAEHIAVRIEKRQSGKRRERQ